MSDLIKREDAIKALRLEYPMMPVFKSLREEWALKTEGFRKAEEVIMKLPSADRPSAVDLSSVYSTVYKSGYEKGKADRPQGEWIEHEWAEESEGLLISNYECSECHSWERSVSNYCPNCGARMKGADDET